MSDAGQVTVEPARDWSRGGFSVVFFLLLIVAAVIFSVLALFQLVWFLWKKSPNAAIQKLAAPLTQWSTDAIRYVLLDTDDKPFPWAPLPGAKV